MAKKQAGIAEAYEEFIANLKRDRAPQLPYRHGEFTSRIWKAFDVRYCIKTLLDERPSYFGHRDVLFAAFIGWCFSSAIEDRTEYIKNLISYRVMEALGELESWNIGARGRDRFGDLLVSYCLHPHFFEEIYIPTGGSKAHATAHSLFGSIATAAVDKAQQLSGAVNLMRIFHYHALHLQNPSFDKASVNKAKDVRIRPLHWHTDADYMSGDVAGTGKLPKTGLSASTNEKHWFAFRSTIAFLYAAHTIPIGDKTLLWHIMAPNFMIGVDRFSTWMARTRWVCTVVLAPANPALAAETLQLIPSIPPSPAPTHDLAPDECELIAKGFQKKRRGRPQTSV